MAGGGHQVKNHIYLTENADKFIDLVLSYQEHPLLIDPLVQPGVYFDPVPANVPDVACSPALFL